MLKKNIFNSITQLLVGLYLFFMLGWPEYIKYYFDLNYPGVTPNRMLAFILLPTLLYRGIKRYRYISSDLEFRFLIYITIVIILTFFISASFSSYESASVKSVFFFLENTLFFAFIMYLFYERGSQKFFFIVLLYSITAVVLVGFIELFKGENPLAQYVITETELIAKNIAGQDRDGVHRIASTYYNPLSFAIHILAYFPILVFLFKKLGLGYKVLIFINILIIPVLIFGTDSRVGIVLWVLLFIYFISSYLYRKSPQLLLIFIFLFLSFSVVLIVFNGSYFYSAFEERFVLGSGRIGSYNDRIMQYVVVFDKILDSLVLGFGFGAANEIIYPLAAVDNLFLSVLLETGIWGLLLILTIFYKYFRVGYFLYRLNVARELFISYVTILLFFTISSSMEIMAIVYLLIVFMLYEKRSIERNSLMSK